METITPEQQERKHNTSETSRESFQLLSNEGRLIDEKKLCYEAIKQFQPVNSRQLSKLINRERTNVTRSLYDLEHEILPSIKVAFIEKCPTTNRRVKFYTLIDWIDPATVQQQPGKISYKQSEIEWAK